jgi:5-formyltetrahydrofolate cyclo-ligase
MTAQAGSVSFPSPSSPAGDPARDALRSEMRKRRRSLSSRDRALASKQFQKIANRAWLFGAGMHVGLYLPYGHEANCTPLIDLARARGCRVYVPRIVSYRGSRMRFVPMNHGAKVRRNRHGIAEPTTRSDERIATRRLDLVILPVVAIDHRGFRLGSGAGFYDRALQHLRAGRRWRKPKLIALAYEFQRIDHLPSRWWDVPVDGILTEKQLYRIPSDPHEQHP